MTHSVPAIESYLPEVGSPLFHHAVEEVASIWQASPSASYEEVVFQYLVNSLVMFDPDDEDSWYNAAPPSSSAPSAPEQKESFFVANKVSEEVNRFLLGQFPAGPKERVAACTGGNRCSDATCQLFHGPLCEFHAGMKVHFGGPKRGQKMTCGKGLACPFDHASAELRSARSAAGLQEKRFRHAPKLATEADILSVFPSMIWRFSDVYTYENLSSAEMDLLEICLERSHEISVTPLQGGLQIGTTDFMDSRDLPEMEVRVPICASVPEGFTEVRRRR
jgi:hypothetical protein